MEAITEVINGVGFPIAACIFMAFQNNKLNDTIGKLTTTLALIDKRLAELERKE